MFKAPYIYDVHTEGERSGSGGHMQIGERVSSMWTYTIEIRDVFRANVMWTSTRVVGGSVSCGQGE